MPLVFGGKIRAISRGFLGLKASSVTGVTVQCEQFVFRVVWFVLIACQQNVNQLIKSSILQQSLSFLLLKNLTIGFQCFGGLKDVGVGVWKIRWLSVIPRIKRLGNSRENYWTNISYLWEDIDVTVSYMRAPAITLLMIFENSIKLYCLKGSNFLKQIIGEISIITRSVNP